MSKFLLAVVVAGAAWAQNLTEFGAGAAAGSVGGAAGKSVSDGLSSIFGKVDQQTKAAAKDAKPDKAKAAPVVAPASPEPAAAASAPVASVAPASVAPAASMAKAAPAPEASPAASAVDNPAPKPAVKRAVKSATKPSAKLETDHEVGSVRARTAPVSVPDPPPPAGQRVTAAKPAQRAVPPVVVFAPILPPPPPPREASADDLKRLAAGTMREDVLKLGPPASRISMFDDGHLTEIYSYTTRNTTIGVVRLNDGAVSRVELR